MEQARIVLEGNQLWVTYKDLKSPVDVITQFSGIDAADYWIILSVVDFPKEALSIENFVKDLATIFKAADVEGLETEEGTNSRGEYDFYLSVESVNNRTFIERLEQYEKENDPIRICRDIVFTISKAIEVTPMEGGFIFCLPDSGDVRITAPSYLPTVEAIKKHCEQQGSLDGFIVAYY